MKFFRWSRILTNLQERQSIPNTVQQPSACQYQIYTPIMKERKERWVREKVGKRRKMEGERDTLTSPSRGIVKVAVKTGSKKGTMHSNISEDRGAYTWTVLYSIPQQFYVYRSRKHHYNNALQKMIWVRIGHLTDSRRHNKQILLAPFGGEGGGYFQTG